MKKLMQRSAYVLSALVTVFAVGYTTVTAQNNDNRPANGFRISPVRSELIIEKGASTEVVITLENPAEVATIATPVVNDFIPSDDESGEPRLLLDDTAETPKNSFKKLVSGLSNIELGPREKKDITITVSVPEDASAGGYYGAVRYVPQVGGVSNVTNVGLTASVGTIVLVRVPGDLKEKLNLLEISAATKRDEKYFAKSFFTSGKVSILTRLDNIGDIHLQPFGKILIKDTFGKKVQEVEFNNTNPRDNILPGSKRRIGTDLQDMKWFGRYTIEANLAYGAGGGELITARTTFWYIPTLALYGIIFAILAVVAVVYWFIRKQKASKRHKHDVNKRKN